MLIRKPIPIGCNPFIGCLTRVCATGKGATRKSHVCRRREKRLDDAADVLSEIMSSPDKGIPEDLLAKSACVVVVPSVKKGAFIIATKSGRGFIVLSKARSWLVGTRWSEG